MRPDLARRVGTDRIAPEAIRRPAVEADVVVPARAFGNRLQRVDARRLPAHLAASDVTLALQPDRSLIPVIRSARAKALHVADTPGLARRAFVAARREHDKPADSDGE